MQYSKGITRALAACDPQKFNLNSGLTFSLAWLYRFLSCTESAFCDCTGCCELLTVCQLDEACFFSLLVDIQHLPAIISPALLSQLSPLIRYVSVLSIMAAGDPMCVLPRAACPGMPTPSDRHPHLQVFLYLHNCSHNPCLCQDCGFLRGVPSSGSPTIWGAAP